VLAQARRSRRIVDPILIPVDSEAAAQGWPAGGEHDVLYGGGHAVHEPDGFAALPARLGGPRRIHGACAIDEAESVDPGIELFDAIQNRLRDFHR
jgi:hypothetical protein